MQQFELSTNVLRDSTKGLEYREILSGELATTFAHWGHGPRRRSLGEVGNADTNAVG